MARERLGLRWWEGRDELDILPRSDFLMHGGAELKSDIYADFHGWLKQHAGRQYELHEEHVNAAFVKMLRTIGFDKGYVRGEGCYLWDGEGNKYLDLLTGWGVFALGRNHPKIRAVLRQVLDQQLPNLVRMDCSILSGLVAEKLTGHAG